MLRIAPLNGYILSIRIIYTQNCGEYISFIDQDSKFIIIYPADAEVGAALRVGDAGFKEELARAFPRGGGGVGNSDGSDDHDGGGGGFEELHFVKVMMRRRVW